MFVALEAAWFAAATAFVSAWLSLLTLRTGFRSSAATGPFVAVAAVAAVAAPNRQLFIMYPSGQLCEYSRM